MSPTTQQYRPLALVKSSRTVVLVVSSCLCELLNTPRRQRQG
jgi:hypothetical protein